MRKISYESMRKKEKRPFWCVIFLVVEKEEVRKNDKKRERWVNI